MLYFSEYSSAIRKPKKKCVIQHNVGYNKASFCLHMTNIMYSDCKCKNILARATWSNTFWMRMYFVASWLAWLNHSWQANVPITCCHMIVQLCISNGVKCMDAIQHWSRAKKKKKKICERPLAAHQRRHQSHLRLLHIDLIVNFLLEVSVCMLTTNIAYNEVQLH